MRLEQMWFALRNSLKLLHVCHSVANPNQRLGREQIAGQDCFVCRLSRVRNCAMKTIYSPNLAFSCLRSKREVQALRAPSESWQGYGSVGGLACDRAVLRAI
ncbi:hypothetical protein BAUCODRAFT_28931 [Baudoinia panamericana UAMH 10762]|uniref:Uncharacterized protein n=1 Tax=Baudoinia panamericana (strain UAMH 10762) TaxID=717646 RepID=M2N8V8_BAUPA|nr:uncharacterized protein BAUCODRAFT_28931 [Baudoinia panamericana UAMH 10762]EMD00579.1 hypothetical protein BAUCODRAFT_28931 [Baudoinia panamericana UAMH 10762]